MPLFPYERFDVVEYSALPEDAHPELLFAAEGDGEELEVIPTEQRYSLLNHVIVGTVATHITIILTIGLNPLVFLGLFCLTLYLIACLANQACMHFIDIASLDKRLRVKAERGIPEHFEGTSFVPTFTRGAYIAFIIVFFLAYSTRGSRISIIPQLFVVFTCGISIHAIYLLWTSEETRGQVLKVFLQWIKTDYPERNPCAFSQIRIPQRMRVFSLLGTFALLLITVPPMAFYNPVILFFTDADTLSVKYPATGFKFSKSVEESIGHVPWPGFADLIKTAEISREQDNTATARKLEAEAGRLRKYQLAHTHREPSGWLKASAFFGMSHPFASLVSWIFSVLMAFLQCILIFLSITVVTIGRMFSLLAPQMQKHIGFDNEWQGVVARLERSKDPYEQESLFIGFLP